MRKKHIRSCIRTTIFCFLVINMLPLKGQDVNTHSLSRKGNSCKSLFDGKTFSGWRSYYTTDKPAKGWVVENGCIKNLKGNGRPRGGGGDLMTDDVFYDFEFSFEWNIEAGGNSGVYYLFQERQKNPGFSMYRGDDGTSPVGFEYQLVDDARHDDVVKNGPIRSTGALYSLIPPSNTKKVNPAGTFNHSSIIVKGKHIEHWLNGEKILAYDLESPILLQALAQSKFKHAQVIGKKAPTRILLQDHGNEIRFRNLKIRILSPSCVSEKEN